MPDVSDFIVARGLTKAERDAKRKQAAPSPERTLAMSTNEPQLEHDNFNLSVDPPIRRPGYGVMPFKPTWAKLEVLTLQGSNVVEIFDSCSRGGVGRSNSNFILQSMRWTAQESSQVIKSYGDWYMADVGEDPRIMSIGGTLIESANFPWFREWVHNWDQFLRARRCIINRTEIVLTIDGVAWRGYMLSCDVQRQHSHQSSWNMLPFGMQFVLRSMDDAAVDGVKVGPHAGTDENSNPVIEFYSKQFTERSDNDAGLAALGAFRLELVAGVSSDASRLPDVPDLEFPEIDEEFLYQLNINRITAIAAAMNAHFGRQIYSLGDLRRGLISMQNSALQERGLNQPYGSPGNQNDFSATVSRKIDNAADDVASWATKTGTRAGTAVAGSLTRAVSKSFTW